MSAGRVGFAAGLALGLAAGAGGALAWHTATTAPSATPDADSLTAGDPAAAGPPEPTPSPPASPPALPALAPDPGPPEPDPVATAPEDPVEDAAEDTPATGVSTGTKPSPTGADRARALSARQAVRELYVRARQAAAGSAEREAALQELRAALGDPDPSLGARAASYLSSILRRDAPSPELARALLADSDAMPADHPARPTLVALVARTLPESELPVFLARMVRDPAPRVRQALLGLVTEGPQGPMRDYLMELVASERDPGVLKQAWRDRTVQGVLSRTSAPRFVGAVEHRLGTQDLEPLLRSQGLYALAHAALFAPEAGQAALDRLAAAEPDPGLAGLARAFGALVAAGEANTVTLKGAYGTYLQAVRRNSGTAAASNKSVEPRRR